MTGLSCAIEYSLSLANSGLDAQLVLELRARQPNSTGPDFGQWGTSISQDPWLYQEQNAVQTVLIQNMYRRKSFRIVLVQSRVVSKW